ncbi:phosphatidylinositol 4-phosphate 5-kinase 7-like isoform X2 [Gastrolobium bilobum]|uniref:phosphatidylinositol 4-phosphate 5-kinase 7-like isoform X2 n=1 Tax=Gastrolobium bilobum TaxID=150636 RepID=UPI002AB3283E|nr:phosphatidylinositol 4-phosphate 5-kinase 7-like isoform X2 [Gastrolobium bilobum]
MEDSGRFEEKSFSSGDVYIGKIKGILPHGNGKYTWSDGTVYEGDWVDGKRTGKGLIIWPSGAKYEGEFSGGYLQGYGTLTRSTGCIYTGGWRMNAEHGIGRKEYFNSDIYEGLWKEGIREGSGRYSWKNGNMYIGIWKNGKLDGRGVMKWAHGDVFDGCWVNGLRQGYGVYRYADGGVYLGTWSKGLKDGKGTFYPAGSKQPSLRKWCSALNSVDDGLLLNTEKHMAPKSRFKRSVSEKISVSGRSKSSRQISHRTSSLDANWSLHDPADDCICRDSSPTLLQSFHDGQSEASGISTLVYEREYMQGVLIMERTRNYSDISHKNERQNKFSVKQVKESSCVDVFGGSQRRRSYYLKLNLQLGIRYTVGKITPVPAREVRSSDFGDRARIRMYFPKEGSRLTPPHCSIDFYWKDYCPMVFRNLREMFKLDAAEYMMSICGDCGLRDISSPGKSGSIFFLSQDDRFVIKTLKKYELKVLLNMLPKYYHHVGNYENTLITKFFGLHRITLRGGKKVRFVVMGNMFCTELHIHRRYDLKGSTEGRYTDKDKINSNTTLKDLDLLYEFHMDKKLRESLFKQISLDCMFLKSQHIIDYSLLLGLHFRAPENLKALVESPGSMQLQDSLPSEDDALKKGEELIIPKGLLLVAHEPDSVNTAPGPHIRGNTLRAYSIGDKEVDLLLPGTARLRVQLGVNMPAQATRKLQEDKVDASEVELFEVYDVVLYMGIIDILQEYNMKKKIEHAYKSLRFDPMTISVVEPNKYAERFINFLEKKVFPETP